MINPDIFQGGENDLPVEERLRRVERTLSALTLGATVDTVPMHIFAGGRMPKRQTDGAIGFDAYARAVVDETTKVTTAEGLRVTRADFLKTPGWEDRLDNGLRAFCVDDPNDPEKYAITLPRGERCMVGLGFATAMQYPLYYWVAPRSGFAARGITLGNSPGTVDPDYRGEAGALVFNNSHEPFTITHGMRIAQVIFQVALIPAFEEVLDVRQLPLSNRGAGGFGSTGAHG